ncbi:MAG: hypothetical protein OEL53_05990 [Rhodospirillales bacterium]|nr:hypothetical protein [Rhodospirillales bacterium]
MLFHPSIIALLLASALSSLALVGSALFAVTLLRHWNLSSGSERQIVLEQRTYLVTTVLKLALFFEAGSLLLFVFNADKMAKLFVGAMCAVGTLNVNPYGFPALILKIAVFFLSAAWLMLHHIDSQGYDYPLIRIKYAALLFLAPVALVSAFVQLTYFLDLKADVLTSCCSTLFGGSTVVTTNNMGFAPEAWSLAGLVLVLAATGLVGLWHLKSGRGGLAYALLSLSVLVVALIAIVSAISVYVYEQPHHHCPFCMLKQEYGYVGYALYLPLFLGTATGIGAGLASFAGRWPSLSLASPALSKRFAYVSLLSFLVFAGVAVGLIMKSHLILFEGFA